MHAYIQYKHILNTAAVYTDYIYMYYVSLYIYIYIYIYILHAYMPLG